MKKTLFLLLIAFTTIQSFAQKKITEGVIEYDITYGELPEQAKKDADILPKQIKIYFKNEKARIEISTFMGPVVSITNNTTNEAYTLMDMMGKKVAMKNTLNEAKKIQSENPENSKVTITNETKKILGYKCKKAIITTVTNGQEYTFDCYFTEDLPVVSSGAFDPAYSQINGCMLQYSIRQNNLNMQMKARSIKAEAQPDGYFEVPKEYEIITQQQATGSVNKAR